MNLFENPLGFREFSISKSSTSENNFLNFELLKEINHKFVDLKVCFNEKYSHQIKKWNLIIEYFPLRVLIRVINDWQKSKSARKKGSWNFSSPLSFEAHLVLVQIWNFSYLSRKLSRVQIYLVPQLFSFYRSWCKKKLEHCVLIFVGNLLT